MMRTALLCLTAVLLLAATLCQAETGPVGPCKCIRTSRTVLQVSRIKNYSVQKAGLCHIDAVIFTTLRGINICSDPKKPWVKKAMETVDGRRRTSTAIPTTTAFRPTWKTTAASWPPHCCLKTPNTRIPVNKFVRYTVQTAGLCPINAIVFLTEKGKSLCYNPDLDWVKNAMTKVDQRKEENRGGSSGPAASPKLKNGPRKSQKGKRKGKKQRKRQKKQ